jgi:hypothetical protein
MKTRNKFLYVGLCIGIFTGMINATPSTQIWIPSTDIQGFGVFHLGWDSYIKTAQAESEGYNYYEGTVTNGGVTVGLLPFKKVGLEVGIDYRDVSAVHQYPVYFNAKIGVPEDAFFKYQPAVAFGGYDFGTKKNYSDYNVMYGLLAKNIWKLGRISAGYYSGNDKMLLDDKLEKDNSGVLVSWDRTISELTDKLWLAVDYMGAKNCYGAFSFGAAYYICPDASFIIGYDIYNNDNYKPTVTIQVDMNLPAVQTWFKK